MGLNEGSTTGRGADGLLTVSQAWDLYRRSAAVDPVTMSGYAGVFSQHVEPALGGRQIASVGADDVQQMLTAVTAKDLSHSTARMCRVVLSAVSRHAVSLGVLDRLPTEGVPAPRSDPRPPRVMTPEEYLSIREHLPTAGAQLLADVMVHTGIRVGEAVALMPEDFDGRRVVVRRALTEPGRRFTADGQRFVLREHPKNGDARSVIVGESLSRQVSRWCADTAVAEGELVFQRRSVLAAPSGRVFPQRVHRAPLTPERLSELGTFTGPNGLRYQHGTMNGYVTGRCREACCRQAISEYSSERKRARRAAEGTPPRRSGLRPPAAAVGGLVAALDPLGPRDWGKVWTAAASAADLGFVPLARETRHAHASWLNSGGISVEAIAERLGHRDERSTRCYVRPVGEEPDPITVMEALLGGDGSPHE